MVTDEESCGKVEGPLVEVPLPSPGQERCFSMDSMAKQDIVCAPLVLEGFVSLPGYPRDESGSCAHDFLASVMETTHLVPRVDTDGAGGGVRGGEDSSKTGVISGYPSNPRFLWEGCIGLGEEE